MIELSIVVPVFDEEDVVGIFLSRITPILENIVESFEILFVNDGSRDTTLDILRAENLRDPRVRWIDLSRNFGKEAALTAGLLHARGRAIVPIDVDLQDPPELIGEFIAKWREGYEVVLARRVDRRSDSAAKRISSEMFYRLIGRLSSTRIPSNVGDFRLMDRKVVEALRSLPERTRFMKGIFAWLGFRHAVVDYTRPAREAGTTKWKPIALWGLALEGIVSFSSVPLKLWSYVGACFAAGAILYGIFIVLRTILFGTDLPGYASLVTMVLLSNGVVLIGLGMIGEYLSRVFLEVKGRPVYLIRETCGVDAVGPPATLVPSHDVLCRESVS